MKTIAAGTWLAAIAGAFYLMAAYGVVRSPAGAAPRSAPQALQVQAVAGVPTLAVALHPHCPCSKATLEELAVLLEGMAGPVTALAYIYKPMGADSSWDMALREEVSQVRGLRAIEDVDGLVARSFGAAASGHIVLYGEEGALLFSGGITAGRGHAGANPAADALEIRLTGTAVAARRFPVFGCLLSRRTS